MKTIAPAKINWTLEVLRKRDDGYHEIRSVMQTIDLCDVLSLEPADRLDLEVDGGHTAGDDDLILKAARVLGSMVGKEPRVRVQLEKRVPVAAGLGGGSSDAAATLRLLNATWDLQLTTKELQGPAAEIGSDVAFFLNGGTAFAEGRGDEITALPDLPEVWLVVIVPPVPIVHTPSSTSKSAAMYAALQTADFTDGSYTETLAEAVQEGARIRSHQLYNCFDMVAYRAVPNLSEYRWRLRDAGAKSEHVAGSGPAMFALFDSEEEARKVADDVADGVISVFVARTLGAGEATAIVSE